MLLWIDLEEEVATPSHFCIVAHAAARVTLLLLALARTEEKSEPAV
ncbi:MAG: hypothetical protein JO363_19380 [Solirubrobacterales bacterium]|nr:hypothetical protein [Solirubrobacterales bacterium]